MDPEVQAQLEEQFRQLTESLSEMNATMASTVEAMKNSNTQQVNNSSTQNNLTKNQTTANNNSAAAATKLDEINKDYNEKTAKIKENLTSAFDKGLSSVSQFTTALLSSERGFSKYGNAVESATDAFFDATKGFGVLGFAIGGVVKLFGMAAGALTKQADNINNFADSWKKAGAIGGLTNTELTEMARQAGYASQDLERLAKPIATLGPAAVNLGGSTIEGQRNFMNLIKVGPEVQARFNRLGYQLEEVNELQAHYVSLQRMSGTAYASDAKTQSQLQKNSLEYAENLIKLTAITGQTIDETKKQQEEAAKDYRETVARIAENAKIERLEQSANEADRQEAANLRKIQKAREQLAMGEASVFALFGQNMGDQIRDFVRSGRVNEDNIAAFRLGGEELRKLKELVDSGAGEEEIAKQTHKLKDKMRENLDKNSEAFATTVNTMAKDESEEFGKGQVGDREFLQKMGAMVRGKTSGQAATEATGGVTTAGEEGFDQAADTRAKMTLLEQNAKIAADRLLESINPFLGNTGILKQFAIGIAAVTAGLLAIFAVSSLAGGLSGIKAAFSGGGDTPGGGLSGGGSSGKLPSGIRKADLLDKRGRVLQGAALDARMEKLAKQRAGSSGNEIVDALKSAGKNALQVMKGGAALGVAIGAIGAGIAGATWLMGGAISKFADGLSKFNDINGPNLKAAGIGMAGLGAGILAMGAGAVLNVVGALAEAVGAKSPLETAAENLYALSALDLDVDKIQKNSDAFLAFGTAMGAIGAIGGLGEIASSIASGISGFFRDEDDPRTAFTSFVEFSHLDIDEERTKKNATAYKYFADAMASYNQMGMLDALGVISTALAESALKFFTGEPPLDRFVAFSALTIDPVRSFLNSLAFTDFATAMSQYRGSAGIINTLSSLLGGKLGELFGMEGPIEAFVNFSKIEFGPNAVKNAKAFYQFVRSLTLFAGGSSSILSGLSSYAAAAATTVVDTGKSLVEGAAEVGKQALDWLTGGTSQPTTNVKPKNLTIGGTATLNNVDSDLVKRFYSAAKDYGKPVNINSAYRPDEYQAQLWVRGRILNEPGIFTPAKPRNPQTITYKGKQYNVPGSGKGSPHLEGRAIDMSPAGKDYAGFDPYLKKYGLKRPFLPKDPPHVQKAAYGGIFESAGMGQGDQVMAALDPNSILMKLAKTPAERDGDLLSANEPEFDVEEMINMDGEMRIMLIEKLDKMLTALDEGKSTSKKMLRTSIAG